MTAGSSTRPLASFVDFARTLATFGLEVRRSLARIRHEPVRPSADAETAGLLASAEAARERGRHDEAFAFYRAVLDRDRAHVGALRAMRELSVEGGRWTEALAAEERLLAAAPSGERPAESEWLAAILYELGREELGAGRMEAAIARFRQAVRADRQFVPAAIALGDAHEAAGDAREALRAWERAAEGTPSLPVLARLERAYRRDGRPSRMIGIYRTAAERAPDDLAIASALGRVYFELEMLDEAADQFEKVEVRAPELPVVHAYLGAVFERRGDMREALVEYRRALRLAQAFSWPHQCRHCRRAAPTWEDRCRQCGHFNTLHPQ